MRAIPDPEALVRHVHAHATQLGSSLHGDRHWRAVASNGLELLPGSGADPAIVFAFALIHDSQRLNDGHDPEHGPRAAAFARTIPRTLLDVGEPLYEAIRTHTESITTTEPNAAVCHDADRLDLWRVGIRPSTAFLSTAAARRIAGRGERRTDAPPDWLELYARFTTSAPCASP